MGSIGANRGSVGGSSNVVTAASSATTVEKAITVFGGEEPGNYAHSAKYYSAQAILNKMKSNMHDIDTVERIPGNSKVPNEDRRLDVYIASGDAYFASEKQLGDRIYIVGKESAYGGGGRTYKFHDEQSAREKAEDLAKRRR